MIKNKEYSNLQEFVDDVNTLGNWKNQEDIKDYVKVLGNIIKVNNGFKIKTESKNGLCGELKGSFPAVVIEAIVSICKTKFPSFEEISKNRKILPDLPEMARYLPLATFDKGISALCNQTSVDFILEEQCFGYIGLYKEERNVLGLIESSKTFMEKIKNQKDETSLL